MPRSCCCAVPCRRFRPSARRFFRALWHFSSGTGALLLGLMGYVASMGCWYLALHRMALSKAYALLSLSYILVWGAAILLPGWGESFSWQGLAGVGLIMLGVLVIFRPAQRVQNGSETP